MLVVHNYLYSPGCCWMCRSVNMPTIDTGIDLDHPNSPDDDNPSANKRFYICADCGVELARMVLEYRNLELITAGSNQVLAEMVETLTSKNLEFVTRINELEAALRVVKTIPAAPDEVANKKTFKVVVPKEVDL